MLNSLKIQNFRGFRCLEINDLGAVNIVGGRNNAGKTSLLEAIFLLSGGGNASLAAHFNFLRIPHSNILEGAVMGLELFLQQIFHRQDMDSSIQIETDLEAQGSATLKITLEKKSEAEIPWFADGPMTKSLFHNRSIKAELFRQSESKPAVETRVMIKENNLQMESPGSVPLLFPCSFHLNRESIDSPAYARQLADLRWQKEDEDVLDALKILEPRLKSVSDISLTGNPLIVGDIGFDKLVPLASMGEGMNQIARIILKMVSAQGGVALIDEVENGFHYSVQTDVWKAVDELARRSNIQVFAATHSRECVLAAHEAIKPERLRYHRLEQIDGEIRCRTYRPDILKSAFEYNFEVR